MMPQTLASPDRRSTRSRCSVSGQRTHQQIASKDGITPANAGQYHISAGLVTRAWEDELNDVDSHRRVFHYGYDL